MSERDIRAVVERVVNEARGDEQIEAYAVSSRDTEIRAYDGEVESLSVAEVDGVGVRVIVDGRQGYAWAGSLDDDVVAETVAEARDNAAFSAVDEFVGLVAPNAFADISRAELDLWRDDLVAMPTDEKVGIALELERATRAADNRIRTVDSADWSDGVVESAVANSLGVRASLRRTMCSVSVFAIAADGEDTKTGYAFSSGRRQADLDVDATVAMAVERSTRLLGAVQPKSRRLPIVFDPLVTQSVLGVLSAALSGDALIKGRTMFADREGEQVAADGVTLVDDPTLPAAPSAAPHDSEGVPCRRTTLIADGVLRAFLHNAYTGRRSGAGTTGSAVRAGFKSTPGVGCRALHLQPGDLDPAAILARAGDALYVQGVQGMHSGTNPVSGDFSVGAEGLLIRNGVFAEPVREVTIASTLPRMLLDVVAVGSDLTWLPGPIAGATVLVGEMTMSGS